MATYEALQARHRADAAGLMGEMLERIEWPPERLAAHRGAELRRLVRLARDLSPWHRKRLSGVDPDEVDEASLAELPVMTKDDLISHFDEIVTDDRLRRSPLEAHLAGLTGDAYLFDRYHAVVTSGSTGRRSVFVYDWDAWPVVYCGVLRYDARARALDPALTAAPPVAAMVAADNVRHISSALAQTFSGGPTEWHRLPVTLPIERVVAGLNSAEPSFVLGYPSMLHRLAHEARAGRLRIRPRRICSSAEALLPETRRLLEDTWGVPVVNFWGTTEAGVMAIGCGAGPHLHLSDDTLVIEAVDSAGRPAAVGQRSDKIYVTNLFNRTVPLIRYEITDQITLIGERCTCGSTHRLIEDPYGRLDDCFDYGGRVVHPHVFRSALAARPEITEYQVRQTAAGAHVRVRCTAPLDAPALERELEGGLAGLGLVSPAVTVTPVDHLERGTTGKLLRFVPSRGTA